MQRSVRNKAVLFTIVFSIWILIGSTGTAAAGRSNQGRIEENSAYLRILDNIPQSFAGYSNLSGVPDDSTFSVLIESEYGIDTTDTHSIRFEIDDGVNFPYQRDLGSDTMRVVWVEDEDPYQTLIWVVYDRSLETHLPPLYFSGKTVRITVDILDMLQHRLSPQQIWFKIETDPGHTPEFDSLPEYDFIDSEDLISDERYDSGMEILGGELAGAKIFYISEEPLTPGFGPMDEIEAVDIADTQGVGAPLNLVPHTIFHTPVKLLIPFPPGTDIGSMDIFYHNGTEWVRACDADGNVLPGGRGWMVAGSRVNHYLTDMPQVEIQVYHFSAVQGGYVIARTENDNDSSGTKVVIKCFIDAAVDYGVKTAFGLHAFLWVLGIMGLFPIVVLWFCNKWNGFYLKRI